VPETRTGYAGAGAPGDVHTTGRVGRRGVSRRLARRRRPAERVIQRDDVLLVLGARTERPHADVERTVLPEDVVVQLRIREGPAGSVAGCAAGVVALGAGDGGGNIRG